MTPEQIVALGGVVSGVVAVMAAGLKALWNAYQKQIAARMEDKDTQCAARLAEKEDTIAEYRAQRDKAIEQRDVAVTGWHTQTTANAVVAAERQADKQAERLASRTKKGTS